MWTQFFYYCVHICMYWRSWWSSHAIKSFGVLLVMETKGMLKNLWYSWCGTYCCSTCIEYVEKLHDGKKVCPRLTYYNDLKYLFDQPNLNAIKGRQLEFLYEFDLRNQTYIKEGKQDRKYTQHKSACGSYYHLKI